LKRGGSEDPAVIQTYFTSESKVAYSCVATNKRETKCRIVIVSLVIKKRTITRESDDGSLKLEKEC
jgi:hypothetical protein